MDGPFLLRSFLQLSLARQGSGCFRRSQFHVIYYPTGEAAFIQLVALCWKSTTLKLQRILKPIILHRSKQVTMPAQNKGWENGHYIFLINFQRQKGKNKGGREKHQFVASLICIHWSSPVCALIGDHTQLWCIKVTLYPTELFSQDQTLLFYGEEQQSHLVNKTVYRNNTFFDHLSNNLSLFLNSLF